MIPKIIHYCWLGGKENQPLVVKESIKSWKRLLPDYQIIEWNESNLNFKDYPEIVQKLYDHKEYGFVPDIIRMDLLYKYGGIYLDTDMFLVKRFDQEILNNEVFIGSEKSTRISLGIIGATKESPVIKELYDLAVETMSRSRKRPPASTHVATKYLKKNYDLPMIKDIIKLSNGLVIYPQTYFYPIPYDNSCKCKFTENTIGAHLWNASWISSESEWSKKKDKIVFDAIKQYNLFDLKL